ncbi:hypothetical protein [Flexivirga lutea]
MLLVPPALVKVGTTGWRIVRYYAGDTAYRRTGPPQLMMRILGPLVVFFTLAVLATGILIGVQGPAERHSALLGVPVTALFLHKATFFAWLAVMTIHVLGRTIRAAKVVAGRERRRVAGGAARFAVLAGMAVCSVGLAMLLAGPWISAWQQHGPRFHQ